MRGEKRIAMHWPFFLFLSAIAFGARKFVYQFTPGFDEYEAVFAYAGDFVLFCFLFLLFLRSTGKEAYLFWGAHKKKLLALFGFVGIAAISLLFADHAALALYRFSRLLFAAAFAVALGFALAYKHLEARKIFQGIIALSVIESFIALLQVVFQKNIGIWFLGEPILGRQIPGVSKIIIDGATIIRGYGTFPHPNVLSAFLLFGLLSVCVLFLERPNRDVWRKIKINDAILIAAAFFIILGLILSFSRTAWFVGGAIVLLYFAFLFFLSMGRGIAIRKSSLFALVVVIVALLFSVLVKFGGLILPRAEISRDEPAVTYRVAYNNLGMKLIKDRPWGVGMGNQVVHSVTQGRYAELGMDKAWQWQPIHNIYLLAAAEIGIWGLALLLLFLYLLVRRGISSLCRSGGRDNGGVALQIVTALAMLLLLLLFGLFDHFSWTLYSGQMMLWLAIGLLLGLNEPEKKT